MSEIQNAIRVLENDFEDADIWLVAKASLIDEFKVDEEQARKDGKLLKDFLERVLTEPDMAFFTKYGKEPTVWEYEKLMFGQNEYNLAFERYYEVLLIEAQNKVVDSAFQYLERKRIPKERFYMPRRKKFLKIGVTQALQGMVDDEYDIVCLSLIPGAGKTTIEKMFNALVAGWFPRDYNLFYSHSGDITRMYYDGVLDIVSNVDEYTWGEIFPSLRITSQNAKLETFNVGKYKPFGSIQCTSVGASNSGKVRASRFLFVDDMIGGIEQALNKTILDKLWEKYTVDARQRKVKNTDGGNCKELIIATRWSVADPIGRLSRIYENNPRVKIISVPDIDPQTGESNFDYEFGGFTVDFFNDQALLMDDISYRCLYKQEPIEREGLLYHEEDLRRFYSLPDREPDAVLSITDTKEKGIDYTVMPVFYQYDQDFYLVDTLCNKESDYEVQYGRIVDLICEHNVQELEVEANMGGSRIAHEIARRLETLGQRCNVTTKYTESNKETRIIVNAEWVKRHILFKDKQDYAPKSDYAEFMNQLLSYSVEGKNKNDDVPDCLANFVLYITRGWQKRETVIITSPI